MIQPQHQSKPARELAIHTAARASLIKRVCNSGRSEGAYRCTACGGRADVVVQVAADGSVNHSTGACRTAGCLSW